jgi:hypothetical protein
MIDAPAGLVYLAASTMIQTPERQLGDRFANPANRPSSHSGTPFYYEVFPGSLPLL